MNHTAELPGEDVLRCPLCGSEDSRTWRSVPATWQRDQAYFPIVQCTACDHRYLRKRVKETGAGRLYEGYTEQYWSNDPGMRLLWKLQAAYRAGRLMKACAGLESVLDVGSGMPVLARRLRRRHGVAHPESLDLLSPPLLQELKRLDPDAIHHNRLLDDAGDAMGPYDAVTAFHCLEHSYAPRQFVANLASLLRADGTLVLGIPHFDHAGLRVFGDTHTSFHVPYHLHFFSIDTVRSLLEQAGFEVVRIETELFFSSVNSATSLLSRLGMREFSRPRPALILGFLLAWIPAAIVEAITPLGGCVLIQARKKPTG